MNFNQPRDCICNLHLDLMCPIGFTQIIVFLTLGLGTTHGSLILNAEYLPVREGIEEIMPHHSLLARGYSVAVYQRNSFQRLWIGRFHQSAFICGTKLI